MENKATRILDDKWEKKDKIGEGSYGNVYRGINKSSSELIAIKKIKTPVSEDGVPVDTLREVTILRNIEHSNIVK
jgi:serine/threonine protein kinase